jgi:hypothetical protein
MKRKTQSQHEICKHGGGWGSEKGLRPSTPPPLVFIELLCIASDY